MEFTFLVTDVVGSTRSAQALGENYVALLETQRQILQDAISRHGALDVHTEGDAVVAAFASWEEALGAAISGQLEIESHEWPEGQAMHVRMGIHTGEAMQTNDGYIGLALTAASRIGGLAYGGQILLSQDTQSLAEAQLPEGVTFKAVGEHKLKEFAEPWPLFQVCFPGLKDNFPPLGGVQVHLPVELTSFVGREAEEAELAELLSQTASVITLLGAGGSGKTRLAVQVAAMVAHDYPDGVWFVDLTPLRDPGLVGVTIARTLNVREAPGRTLEQSIGDYLRNRRVLLVLDNFEHLLPAANIIPQILADSPNSRVLVTSREALGIADESKFPVAPLSVAESAEGKSPALRLFQERAQGVRPGFEMSESALAAARDICARLDGLPLAIELAAVQVRILTPEDILLRLAKRLPVLTGAARDQPAKRRALSSTIEWSYELLSASEATLFCRLALFRGGFTLNAVQVICEDESNRNPSEQLLESLVSKNLVREVVDENRFTMLQTIREYAEERLGGQPDVSMLKSRHAIFYMNEAERASPLLLRTEQLQALQALDVDLDNLRLALAVLEAENTEQFLRMIAAMAWYWLLRNLGEGRQWFARAPVDDQTTDADLRAAVLSARGRHQLLREGDLTAAGRTGVELLALSTSCQDVIRWRGWAQVLMAISAIEMPKAGLTLAKRAVEDLRARGESWELGNALTIMGEISRAAGELARADECYREALDLFETAGDRVFSGTLYMNLGESAAERDDFVSAAREFEKAISLARQVGNEMQLALCFVAMGCAAIGAGNVAAGALLLGAGANWIAERGWDLQPVEQLMATQACIAGGGAVGAERFSELLAAGRVLTLEQALDAYQEEVSVK